jgi:hypothetical protein
VRRRGRGLALLLALAAATPAWGEPDGETILAAVPASLAADLQARKVVLDARSDAATQAARGFVIFERPVSRVFMLLAQTSRQGEYRPEVETIETVETFEGGSVDEHRMKILFIDIRYRLRNRVDAARRRIEWELAPGFESDLERVEGSWELYALGEGRTLGVFGTLVEVGSGMPSFLQDYVTRKNLPRTLERCRRWVDGDGHAD